MSLVLSATVLWGCATRLPPPINAAASTDSVLVTRADPNRFEVSARIAVAINGKGESFGLIWSRNDGIHQAQILTPLGQRVALLLVDSLGARLIDASGQERTAQDDRNLLRELTGVEIGLASLANWLHGAPSAEDQARWRLKIETGGPFGVASRIEAEAEGKRVRMIVDEYRPLG
jgi:outer membrane biogenesis lipoprotein LolB